MIVADASVVVDFLLGPGGAPGDDLAERLVAGEVVAAPHLLDAEVAQVIRRYVLAGEVDRASGDAMVDDLASLPIQRYPHAPVLRQAFALWANVTVYDGLYLALAASLGCPLVTADAALRRVPGSTADVIVVGVDT